MKLIRCPYCGAEFNRHYLEYVGADPQMQIVTGLFFAFFAVNAVLIHRYFEDWFPLFMMAQLALGTVLVVRGVYKFIRGRLDFMEDIRRHLHGHRHGSRMRTHRRAQSKDGLSLESLATPHDPSSGTPAR